MCSQTTEEFPLSGCLSSQPWFTCNYIISLYRQQKPNILALHQAGSKYTSHVYEGPTTYIPPYWVLRDKATWGLQIRKEGKI